MPINHGVIKVLASRRRHFLPVMGLLVGFGWVSPAIAGEPPDSPDGLLQMDGGKSSDGAGKANMDAGGWNPKFQGYFGFFQNKTAYTYPATGHWSLSRNLLDLGARGSLSPGIKWLASGRVAYDPVYQTTSYYPADVRHDQTLELMFRETYLDASFGDWDLRVGRQHIIWGEMVGLFVADVASAKDLRQFVLQDFDILRTPQWAIRNEYFKGDFHAEAVWIPVVTYSNIGKVGAEFYPFKPPAVPGYQNDILNDNPAPRTIGNTAYGLRLSYLLAGFDTSIFYYSTPDLLPAFSRSFWQGASSIIYTPIHNRVQQWGATFAKDLTENAVLKSEVVYTRDRLVSTFSLSDSDGLVKQNILDYIVGLDFTFAEETRVNLQFFQEIYPDRDPGIGPSQFETGYSLLLSTRYFHPKVEPQILFIQSLNRYDWMLQAKTAWEFSTNWRWVGGLDAFGGTSNGLFGRYDQTDRVYTELRYSF